MVEKNMFFSFGDYRHLAHGRIWSFDHMIEPLKPPNRTPYLRAGWRASKSCPSWVNLPNAEEISFSVFISLNRFLFLEGESCLGYLFCWYNFFCLLLIL